MSTGPWPFWATNSTAAYLKLLRASLWRTSAPTSAICTFDRYQMSIEIPDNHLHVMSSRMHTNQSTPPLASFRATRTNGKTYTLSAGTAHGVTIMSRFLLFDPDLHDADQIVMQVSEIHPFSSILIPYHFYGSSERQLPDVTWPSQISRSDEDLFGLQLVRIDPQITQSVIFKNGGSLYSTQNPSAQIRVHYQDHHSDSGRVKFKLQHISVESVTIPFDIPYTVDYAPMRVSDVVHSMSHFRWHLLRQPPSPVLRNQLKVTLAEIGRPGRQLSSSPNSSSPAMFNAKPGTEYTLLLENEGDYPLYISVFLFDSDLSITACYLPETSSGRQSRPCLKIGSQLSIGGSGAAFPFFPPEDNDVNICFVKIFASTERIDLSAIEQHSPFSRARATYQPKNTSEYVARPRDMAIRGAPDAAMYDRRMAWDAVTVPVRVLRKPSQGHNHNTTHQPATSAPIPPVVLQTYDGGEDLPATPSLPIPASTKTVYPIKKATPSKALHTTTNDSPFKPKSPAAEVALQTHANAARLPKPPRASAKASRAETSMYKGGVSHAEAADTEPPDVLQKPLLSMHAIIIGIDKYAINSTASGSQTSARHPISSHQDEVAPDLLGAAADADSVHDLLIQTFRVPSTNITNLRNHQATREEIIRVLEEIAEKKSIKKNDPILIYYAGHGASGRAPKSWANANEAIQLLVPHDFSGRLMDEPDARTADCVHGIPDRTLAALLDKISAKKGNNITVILDCCHSGSMTRELGEPVTLPPGAQSRGLGAEIYTPSDIDAQLSVHQQRPGSRALWHNKTWKTKGLNSHVLLTACMSTEIAYEVGQRGVFTKALVKAIKQYEIKSLTYSTLIRLLASTYPKQNPQCEGRNQGRLLFDSGPAGHTLFTCGIREEGSKLMLDAGEAHGIMKGALFSVFSRTKILSSYTISVAVTEVTPFTSTVEPAAPIPSITSVESTPTLHAQATAASPLMPFGESITGTPLNGIDWSQRLVSASQPSKDERLKIYLSDADTRLSQIRSTLDEKSGIEFKDEESDADLIIVVREEKAHFRLKLQPKGDVYDLPRTIDVESTEMVQAILSAAHYCWHLRRAPAIDRLRSKHTVQFHALKQTDDFDDYNRPEYEVAGPNLFDKTDEVSIHRNSKDTEFGVKIETRSKIGCYAHAFIFDDDFGIYSVYSPNSGVQGGGVDCKGAAVIGRVLGGCSRDPGSRLVPNADGTV
ncbi:hypothetical protein BDW22DRAFT_1353447 [Trametopsis cervina]|nr:hypothetical protein BDW22DRAFT_1353447 [Trametopsis cervina]